MSATQGDDPTTMSTSSRSLDGFLLLHFVIQVVVWVVVFPVGLVLGLTRSKWHPWVQVSGLQIGSSLLLNVNFAGNRSIRPDLLHDTRTLSSQRFRRHAASQAGCVLATRTHFSTGSARMCREVLSTRFGLSLGHTDSPQRTRKIISGRWMDTMHLQCSGSPGTLSRGQVRPMFSALQSRKRCSISQSKNVS